MKLPNLLPYAKWIIIVCAALFLCSMLRSCYLAGKVSEQIETRPPLKPREAKAIKAKAKADSVKATVYRKVAVEAIKQADSARTQARKSVAIADSLKAQYNALPSASDSPLSDVERRLATYASPDTAAL